MAGPSRETTPSGEWPEWDDALEEAQDDVDAQLSGLEDQISDAEDQLARHDELLRLLSGTKVAGRPGVGGTANPVTRLVRDVLVLIGDMAVSDQRESFTLEDLIAGPQKIDVELDGVRLDDTLDFKGLLQEVAEINGTFAGWSPDRIGDGADEIINWHNEVVELEPQLPAAQESIDAARAEIGILEPVKANLGSGDAEVQAIALRSSYPKLFGSIEGTSPSRRDDTTDAQQAAVDSAALKPVAPTSGFDPQAPRETSTTATAPAAAPTTPAWEGAGGSLMDGQFSGATPTAAHPLTGASGTASAVAATEFASEEDWFDALVDQGHSIPDAAKAVYGGETPTDPSDTPGPPGTPRLTAADIQAANEDEVHALLSTQFGGFAFFLQKNKTELMVGLNADGMVVAADDPTAVSAKNVLDVIVEQGITDPNRVTGILQNTEWWKNTDAVMRQFDANYGEMSEPEKQEFLEPVLDTLRDEARFLGFEMSTDRARELAVKIAREGEAGDSEYIRGLMVAEGEFNRAETELSDFGAARDQIEALSRSYYVPIGTEKAAQLAEDVYVGTKSATQVEQYFKEMAINKFPTLKNAIEGGFTADQYFAPYKYEIEKMLGRPNVDMYEEFGDVIEYMPDIGGDTPRPMTLGEVRKYVRGLDEWQTSDQGRDSAQSLAYAIGKTFGEVA